ncbi:hypothetical protein JVT61DRAFT_10459 [Boletus reticuloceps]|uniref:IBR domain-containing protein n=1 Tax=Boletus reticuloceps TaxID=495285 RepID=A0A8I3AEY1_9AGAM|nr:hypothetical protein JVT61DRAFT_10459 [Boletus reticuloceps]
MARFFPERSWISSLISRLSSSKLRARVAVPSLPVVRRAGRHCCVVCQDVIHSVEVRAPCSHYFDIGCATHLFQSATRNETLFLHVAVGKRFLSLAFVPTSRERSSRRSSKNKSSLAPSNARFLGPVSEGVGDQVYSCPALGCRRRTCAKCRERHSGNQSHVCRPDAGATQVLELGHASGWARCPGCSHMIELQVGCFHMTCRCETEFCYLCRAPWKTCDCAQWHEQHLVDEEEEEEEEEEEVEDE